MANKTWNCYARNYYLGEVTARNAIIAIELAVEIWKKFSLLESEISVIQVEKDRNKNKINIEDCPYLTVKYPIC